MIWQYPARLLRVVDGDTFDVLLDLGFHSYRKERVRLYKVDTPEVYGPRACDEGLLATKFATDWLANVAKTAEGTDDEEWPLTIESVKYDARGKYGRVLADIYVAGSLISLGEALVRAGHATEEKR